MPGFFTAYVNAALFTSTDDAGEPMDKNYSIANIAGDTIAKMKADTDAFRKANRADLADLDEEQAGHDFWLTRNGHGAGFWDRDLGEVGERLTESAESFGSYDIYIGDDGQIHGA